MDPDQDYVVLVPARTLPDEPSLIPPEGGYIERNTAQRQAINARRRGKEENEGGGGMRETKR